MLAEEYMEINLGFIFTATLEVTLNSVALNSLMQIHCLLTHGSHII